MTPDDDDAMALAESFLRLLNEERYRLARLGMPGRPMVRALHDAIHTYRQAEAAGNADAMAAARDEADRVLKEHLFRVLAAVSEPPPRDRLT